MTDTRVGSLFLKAQKSENFQKLQAALEQFPDVVETQVQNMCKDLKIYKEKPMPHYFDQKTLRVGYKILDGYDYGQVHGYQTAYAYLEHGDEIRNSRKGEAAKIFQERLALLVPCALFSYAEIN